MVFYAKLGAEFVKFNIASAFIEIKCKWTGEHKDTTCEVVLIIYATTNYGRSTCIDPTVSYFPAIIARARAPFTSHKRRLV